MHGALGLLIAGSASAAAHAQTVSDRVTELSFTAELRHDGNALRSAGVVTEQGVAESDERLRVGTSLVLARPFGRNSVSIDGFLGYDFYRRNSRLNRERIALSGDAEIDAGFCQLSLLPKFNRQQSDLYDLAVFDLPGIDSVRNTEMTQVYRGELRCGNPVGIRPLVYYERSYGNNSNPIRKISNYHGETFGGGLSYTNPVLGRFDLSVERENMHYTNRPTSFGLTGFQLDQVRLAASRDIGAVLTADGSIAYSHLKPENSGVSGFNGLSWSLGLTFVPITDLRLRANLMQDLQPDLGNSALYSRNREWHLAATYQLGARTSATVGVSRSDRVYRGASALYGPLLSSDRLDQISGRLDFAASRRLSFGVEVGHEHRNANGTFYDYHNTYVALNGRFTLGTS